MTRLFRPKLPTQCSAPLVLSPTASQAPAPTAAASPTRTSAPPTTPTVTATATRSPTTTPMATHSPTRTATTAPTQPAILLSSPVIIRGGVTSAGLSASAAQQLFRVQSENGRTIYTLQRPLEFDGLGILVADPAVTLDLNGLTIGFNRLNRYGAAGIYAFRYLPNERWGLSARLYPEVVDLKGANGNGLIVRNGAIEWRGDPTSQDAAGSYATGILATADIGTLTVRNVRFLSGSRDGSCVYAWWSNLTITDSWCRNLTESTENRHQIPASIKASGKVIADRNVVEGGNNGFFVGANSSVSRNVIRQSGFATNGYGVHTYKTSGSEIFQNIIVPKAGRGVMINGGVDKGVVLSVNNRVFDNLIAVLEPPNAEFGDNLNPPCFRMRYEADANAIFNNVCFAFAGGNLTAASGIYASNTPLAPDGRVLTNYFYSNTLAAILVRDPQEAVIPFRKYANGITLEKQGMLGVPSSDRFSNNTILTNSYGIRLSGYDGYAYQGSIDNTVIRRADGARVAEVMTAAFSDPRWIRWIYPAENTYVQELTVQPLLTTMKDELLNRAAGVPASWSSRPFYPVHTAFYEASEAFLVNTDIGEGRVLSASDMMIEDVAQGPTRVTIGREQRVRVIRGGAAVPNLKLEVWIGGKIIGRSVSDGSGIASLPIPEFDLTRARGERTFSRREVDAALLGIAGDSRRFNLPSPIRPEVVDLAIDSR